MVTVKTKTNYCGSGWVSSVRFLTPKGPYERKERSSQRFKVKWRKSK